MTHVVHPPGSRHRVRSHPERSARRQTAGVTVWEFWPDYGPGPLWSGDGKPADLASLGLGRDLIEHLAAWNAEYSEDKVPIEGPGNDPG